ncbi:MAG: hypothetical protein E6J90_28650 [Deltaproteobacteria bacterium]|nr:MAG: hypothetical protein E6J90_28650 [Deltaproteobacteria bacterium]
MRALIALVLLGGCFGVGGGAGGGGVRPGVMPMLSELPGDPAKRDAVLDSSNHVAGPEQRKGMTGKERKAETAAATAAAIIGSMFSKTKSVTLGGASQFDENQLIAPAAVPPALPAPENAEDAARPAPPPSHADGPNTDLIPWIKLK